VVVVRGGCLVLGHRVDVVARAQTHAPLSLFFDAAVDRHSLRLKVEAFPHVFPLLLLSCVHGLGDTGRPSAASSPVFPGVGVNGLVELVILL